MRARRSSEAGALLDGNGDGSRSAASSSSSHVPKASSARQVLLFNLSGFIGTVLFYFFHELVVDVYPWETRKSTACWFISYMVSIAWQHALHRWLVFGRDSPYWSSLVKTYICYSLGLGLSSALNDLLVQVREGPDGVCHRCAS